MYLVETIVNRLYRRKMAALLRLEELPRRGRLTPPRQGVRGGLLYVHVPFCESLCPYCSFHRCEFEPALATRYFKALWRELNLYKELGFGFRAVYVGGGTPTVMAGNLVRTLDLARELFDIRDISVETNPNHLQPDLLRQLRDGGVTRLSVGVQSFDDGILQQIGRLQRYGHASEIRRRLALAEEHFAALNVDLIFNIPSQTDEILRRDLDAVDELRLPQVTFYPLMTAPSVESVLKRSLGPMSYAKEKRQYHIILERMRRHYTPSTAWCFSRQASLLDEYLIDYDSYAGTGSGAFGYFNDALHINTFSLSRYLEMTDRGELPITRKRQFDAAERQYYFLLRKMFGLSLSREAFRRGLGLDRHCHIRPVVALLKQAGAWHERNGTITLTDRGKYYWVMAMREFFIAVDTLRDACRHEIDPARPLEPASFSEGPVSSHS